MSPFEADSFPHGKRPRHRDVHGLHAGAVHSVTADADIDVLDLDLDYLFRVLKYIACGPDLGR
jgi:hypothetical protein